MPQTNNPTINPKQMRRLQTLYGQLAAHSLEGNSREARMAWASQQLGRSIASFSDLTFDEARRLIDGLQGQLGLKAPARPRRRMSRDQAHRAGTEGRRGVTDYKDQPQMASAEDLATIERFYVRLGWTRENFDAWLASTRSPLAKRARPTILTSEDANDVRWALKGMLKHRGLWEDRRPA